MDIGYPLVDLNAEIDYSDETALMQTARNGCAENDLAVIIRETTNLDEQNEYGETALMLAIKHDNPKIALSLIKAKANVNISNHRGQTPLMEAAWRDGDNKDIIVNLIAAADDVDIKNQLGHTALLYAAESGQIDSVLALIAAEANINAKNPRTGETPLMLAIQYDYTEIALALIEARAIIINLHDRHNQSALMLAAHLQNEKIISALLKAEDIQINEIHPTGGTALMYAARNGNLNIVSVLIDAGADISLNNENGESALTQAIRLNHKAVSFRLMDLMKPEELLELKSTCNETVLNMFVLYEQEVSKKEADSAYKIFSEHNKMPAELCNIVALYLSSDFMQNKPRKRKELTSPQKNEKKPLTITSESALLNGSPFKKARL